MEKILIIKTGYSETFAEAADSSICSLGDVLRTIPLVLSYFKESDASVSWVTDKKAFELFDIFKHDFNLIDVSDFTYSESDYDFVLNLEKGYPVDGDKNCFGFISLTEIRAITTKEIKSHHFPIFDESSFESKFSEYFNLSVNKLSYEINENFKPLEIHDIGLNWKSGVKWPSKEIEKEYWEKWAESLSRNHTVSWQEGFNNLETYINWIASCKNIITLDSLGLHIARILKKRIIALFGPTTCEVESFQGEDQFFFYRNKVEKEELENKILSVFSNEC